MAVRRPLKYVSGDIKEVSDEELAELVTYVKNRIMGSTSGIETLSVVSSGGDFVMYDTRLRAGTYLTRTDRYPTEAETSEPTVLTVETRWLQKSLVTPSNPASFGWFLYYDGSNLKQMSDEDLYDTIINPAISQVAATELYKISTATSVPNYTQVSSNFVFQDTIANVAAFTAGGIPESIDQSTIVNSYRLYKLSSAYSPVSEPSVGFLRWVNESSLIKVSGSSELETLAQKAFYRVATEPGYRLRFYINGTGTTQGSSMVDTRLNGSGNYQTRFVNADDYRAQEFPNGSSIVVNTYTLKLRQE